MVAHVHIALYKDKISSVLHLLPALQLFQLSSGLLRYARDDNVILVMYDKFYHSVPSLSKDSGKVSVDVSSNDSNSTCSIRRKRLVILIAEVLTSFTSSLAC